MFVFPAPLTTRRIAAVPSLSRAIDHLFNDGYVESAEPRVPAMDVTETDNSYLLSFELPGLTKDQIKVTVQGRRLTLEAGTAAAEPPKEGERALYRERVAAHYARTVSLPAEVDQAASSAKFENGVLTLTLAKRVPTGAAQISIS